MTEDDLYRASTQYRLWSYTEASLASLRASTNRSAAVKVRDAVLRLRMRRDGDGGDMEREEGEDVGGGGDRNGDGDGGGGEGGAMVDCLTVEEELKIVGFYCVKAMDLCDYCGFPTNIKATAVQYLKRFYLTNSPMTYHPKQLLPTAVFLATKTDNNYISLKSFAAKLGNNPSQDDILAPEFLLAQGLRFTFDVRHPHRGLEGGYMQLLTLASGIYHPPPGITTSPTTLQAEMLNLPLPSGAGNPSPTADALTRRIQTAHTVAKDILKTAALLTDVYFLFPPSQIWLSALLIADEPLTTFYLRSHLPSQTLPPLLSTLHTCATILQSSPPTTADPTHLATLTAIDKKLYTCRNPEMKDLLGLHRSVKRDGALATQVGAQDRLSKKRRLEGLRRGKDEDVFGGGLGG